MASAAPRLVTIADGENLLDALAEACGPGDGWVAAVGHVDSVEIRVAGEGADVRKQLRGRLTLAQLTGPRLPDTGEWRCADRGHVVWCTGGEPAAGVVK